MRLYSAKETGTAASGSAFTILQDGPNSYHVTVGRAQYAIYEHFSNIESRDNMLLLINKLEEELFTTFQIDNITDITV